MFRLFVVLLLIAAGVTALGYYRGWFHVDSARSDGNNRITITTDNEKIKKDRDAMLNQLPGSGTPAKEAAPAAKDKD